MTGWRQETDLVRPDSAPCATCFEELLDPADRRFHYPFISCNECGPRFTIAEAPIFRRAHTAMRAFPMCEACEREYRDPRNRRCGAEAISCPTCGPRVQLLKSPRGHLPHEPITAAGRLLRVGAIVAVKGPGGFQFLCDATNDSAVAKLRRRKDRPDKPLAVMVAGVEIARQFFNLSVPEESLLSSGPAPTVLVGDRGKLAASVNPGQHRQGCMLPHTALHHLLVRAADRPLVVTRGARGGEPACLDNDQALERLSAIADAFLVHDRAIVSRCDAPVARARNGDHRALRRGWGYAPAPIVLPVSMPPTLGCGARSDGSFCLAAGERAFLSQRIADLDSAEAMNAYADALGQYRSLFAIEPIAVAHDLHRDWYPTRFAMEAGLPAFPVQHHHAHVAAIMAEHRLQGTVIGVALDGFGLGADGSFWGGEFLVCDWRSAERVGHLRRVRQPGGEAAARNPVQMAIAHAADAEVLKDAQRLMKIDSYPMERTLSQLESSTGSPLTSAAGRLFDAVAALAGVCRRSTYEGHAELALEQVADPSTPGTYEVALPEENGATVVDTRAIVAGVVHDLVHGRPVAEVAGRFHNTMAEAVVGVCRMVRARTGLARVCLAGDSFTNDLLLSSTANGLSSKGFEVFIPRQAPIGDGGIALGQVLVAHARMAQDS